MAYVYFNNNPTGRVSAGDCAVRAVSKALGVDWETAYLLIAVNGFQMGNVISANETWGSVLRQHGFHRENLPMFCKDCYSVADFARDNNKGTYVVGTNNHAVCIIDGNWYDAWNSKDEVPQFFWTK